MKSNPEIVLFFFFSLLYIFFPFFVCCALKHKSKQEVKMSSSWKGREERKKQSNLFLSGASCLLPCFKEEEYINYSLRLVGADPVEISSRRGV